MTIISWSLRDSSGPVDIPISSLDNARLIAEYQSLTPDDRIWCYLPLFFSAGICNILFGTFSSGATLVLQETFDPGEALRLIHDERCTVYHGFANAFNTNLRSSAKHAKLRKIGKQREEKRWEIRHERLRI